MNFFSPNVSVRVVFEFRRPRIGQLLFPLTIVIIYAYHVFLRGDSLSVLETAFFVSAFVLMTVSILVDEVLSSSIYPLVGGGLITVFYLRQLIQEQTFWSFVGVSIGLLFGGYGAYIHFYDSKFELNN